MQLVLEELEKSFGTKEVLTKASFTFEKGKIYGLLGRNGSGKTTLFNCLSREMPTTGGRFYQMNDGISSELSEDEVGYVFATAILPEFLTGYEFLKFYIDINKDKITSDATIDDYFDRVQIKKEDRHRLMKDYSHGMKNKMQMLCCFITKPPVILLDEPLTSFDVVVALEMKNLLRNMRKDHIIIFSTHILQLASDLCDEIVVLHQGKLEAIDRSMLQSPEFESQLIEILKDDEANDDC